MAKTCSLAGPDISGEEQRRARASGTQHLQIKDVLYSSQKALVFFHYRDLMVMDSGMG